MQRIRLLRSFLFGQGIRGHVSVEDSVDDRVYPSTQREQIRLKGKLARAVTLSWQLIHLLVYLDRTKSLVIKAALVVSSWRE